MLENNEKGFTLIEILGVIVIMGIILIVAIPNLEKVIFGNKETEFNSYYDLVKEGAISYANEITDTLGSSKYSGCAEVTLDYLIDKGYVQKFKDSNYTCATNGVIRLRNDYGKKSAIFELYCNDEDGEEAFRKGKSETTETCVAYTPKEEINIKAKLESEISSSDLTTINNDVYLTGTNPNNYIWYSGKLWRIVSFNQSTETAKAVTYDSMTSIYYNYTGANYVTSDINRWVNNDFYDTLKNPGQFLVSNLWYYSSSQYEKQKVGVLSETDYLQIKSWFGGGHSWLTNGKYANGSSGAFDATPTTIKGVRPAITFSSDVLIQGGSGTEADPYLVDATTNAVGKEGDFINTRFSGEYVQFNNKLYRIVSVSADGYTKLIGTTSEGTYVYSDATGSNTFDFSASNIKSDLLSKTGHWYKNLETAGLNTYVSEEGSYCLDRVSGDVLAFHSTKCLTAGRLVASSVGIPKIGDLFTSNISGVSEYWTLNPNTEIDENNTQYNTKINTILPTGGTSVSVISGTKDVVVVFHLESDVKIGPSKYTNSTIVYGSKDNPYTLIQE